MTYHAAEGLAERIVESLNRHKNQVLFPDTSERLERREAFELSTGEKVHSKQEACVKIVERLARAIDETREREWPSIFLYARLSERDILEAVKL